MNDLSLPRQVGSVPVCEKCGASLVTVTPYGSHISVDHVCGEQPLPFPEPDAHTDETDQE